MEDGGTAEVSTIGNEGMIGSAVFFGDLQSHTETIVQIADNHRDTFKMSVAAFVAEMGVARRLL
jgi:hypothetical protein